jgi:hypothetical protein
MKTKRKLFNVVWLRSSNLLGGIETTQFMAKNEKDAIIQLRKMLFYPDKCIDKIIKVYTM